MKILATLLSTLILFISLLPCVDEPEAADQEVVTSYVVDHAPFHRTGGLDLCSPLCACACCSVSVQLTAINTFSLLKPENTSASISLLSVMSPVLFSGAIFHPPKV